MCSVALHCCVPLSFARCLSLSLSPLLSLSVPLRACMRENEKTQRHRLPTAHLQYVHATGSASVKTSDVVLRSTIVYDEASSEGNKDPSASALARTYSPVSQEILFPLTPGCFFGTDAADAGTSELTPLANSCSSASTSWFFLCRSAWVAAHAGMRRSLHRWRSTSNHAHVRACHVRVRRIYLSQAHGFAQSDWRAEGSPRVLKRSCSWSAHAQTAAASQRSLSFSLLAVPDSQLPCPCIPVFPSLASDQVGS